MAKHRRNGKVRQSFATHPPTEPEWPSKLLTLKEKMAPELKNEENLKVDDVEANVDVSKECREL